MTRSVKMHAVVFVVELSLVLYCLWFGTRYLPDHSPSVHMKAPQVVLPPQDEKGDTDLGDQDISPTANNNNVEEI